MSERTLAQQVLALPPDDQFQAVVEDPSLLDALARRVQELEAVVKDAEALIIDRQRRVQELEAALRDIWTLTQPDADALAFEVHEIARAVLAGGAADTEATP